ncbi:TonB-dependent receptor [Saccharibacter sp. 17.LH.SD]|uniref:TonB-dependent receptor domain-containing protein n=1 Tax=Saccharibacter sp. 17.LH.SD TaxID=2689393 RepID=UPI00136B1AF4|nr:TonB-dependent receptor [Saccharibacter sp. 17.LH.SD]MXV44910.1 TonB-dependent receptor [Saccharibacter sp. 17.LH.SD]
MFYEKKFTILSGIAFLSISFPLHALAKGPIRHRPHLHHTFHPPSHPPHPHVHHSLNAHTTESLSVHSRHPTSHGATEVITRATLNQFVTGTNPLQVLALTTPGANFASDDALGLDTVANTLYVRGFNQTQLGMSLDGIPLGGQGFHDWNGLGIEQAEIQENISSLTMSQGAGALDIPSAQTLGGALTFTSSDPKKKTGGQLSQMFGSYHGFRTFVRADSGELNRSGTKFYVAYARTAQNLWKGYGYQQEQQVNAKFVQPINNAGKITAIFDYSIMPEYNYLGLTKNMWRRLGRNTTYLKPDYARAKNYAYYAQNGGVPPEYAGILTNDEISDFAYDGTQTQENILTALTGDFHIASWLDSKTIAYAHLSGGRYNQTDPNLISPTSGVDMAMESGKPNARRIGFVQNFSIHAPYHNEIKTGVWYENDHFSYPLYVYEDGVNQPHSSIHFHGGNGEKWFTDAFNTNTFQFYLQDTYRIFRGLSVNAGFRSLVQTTHGGNTFDNTAGLSSQGWNTYYLHPASGNLTASNAFLPHVGLDYKFLLHHEFYIDIAENMRAYDYSHQFSSGTPWTKLGSAQNSAQSVFNANKNTLRPERTWNYVVGYRFNSHFFSGSIDYYHTDYYNRLAAITTGTTGANTYGIFSNIGRETMDGIDVAGTIRPLPGLAITNSFSWNNAKYQYSKLLHDSYSNRDVSIKGKFQVYYPRFMYKANVNYTIGHASFNFNTTYTSVRYMTYTNDNKIPAYWSSSLTASYDFGKIGYVQNFKTSFGITNLFNQNYIGGIYGAASLTGDDNANLYVAAPRQFFGTITAQF